MSNSSLVTYRKISPNKTSPRNHEVDTISIHCYVGQCTAKQGCDYFANSDVECSPNYVVGWDGSIGQSVDENDRSWCTSSPSNDHRAVTIEVACEPYHPYKVTDKAMTALIKLVADICKRNNIKELKWQGDKNLIGQVDKQNMTVHRWFANKACPGDYLYNKHPYIANEVNKILGNNINVIINTDNKVTLATVKPNIYYQAKTARHGWLPTVTNLNDYAGIEGEPITDVAIKVDKGSVRYRVHVKGEGWLPYVTGYNYKDHVNGYAGNGKPIDALEVYYYTPDDYAQKHGYLCAKYRVSPIGTSGYYDWQVDNNKGNGMDGYAGAFGKSIDKIQITLE